MSGPKTIFRVFKDKNFTQVSNKLLHDNRLTMKTKGLICIMLSLPDTWDFHREHLLTLSADGKDSLKSGIEEGKKFGYITIGQERDERGRITKWIMSVYETPGSIDTPAIYPEAGFPHLEKPHVENPPLSNTKDNINTKTTATKAVISNVNKQSMRHLPSEEAVAAVSNLNERAKKLGIQTMGGIMEGLVKTHGIEKVSQKLEVLENKQDVHNPSGYLQTLLNKNYPEQRSENYKAFKAAVEPSRSFVTIEETNELLKKQEAWKRSDLGTARKALANLKKLRPIETLTH